MHLSPVLRSLLLLILTLLSVMVMTNQFLLILHWDEISLSNYVSHYELVFSIFVIASIGSLFWLLFSNLIVKLLLHTTSTVSGTEHKLSQLNNIAKHQATKYGINVPGIAVYKSMEINAFTAGIDENHAVIVVSQGLLHSLHYDELEAVVAHEITHIAHNDMLVLSLSLGVVNTMVYLPAHVMGWIVDKHILRHSHGYGPVYFMTLIFLQLSVGAVASMLVMWFSRWREFNADSGAALLVGKDKMIRALSCLKAGHNHDMLPREFSAFGISGDIGKGVKRLFASHPPLSERIASLRKDW